MIQIIHDKSLYEHTTLTQEGATYRFFVRDHLGNSRAVLDTQGNLISQFNFEPYGVLLEPQSEEDTNLKYKYTGQERDQSTNYDYMHFRFYASSMGRFLKPDNIIPDITNPQNWNAYTYVKGNPVNFNDPSGHGPNVPSYPAYIPNTHSFGMSWFDQFDSGWLPWARQTAENSWYFGGTRSALGYYHNQYLKGLQKEESFAQENQKTTYSTFPGVLLASFFSNSADIYELGKLLLEGGLIYGQVSIIQLAKDMIALIHGLLIEGVGNYSVLNKGLQAWIEIKSLACEGTPFKIDEKTRNNIQDSTDEIYRISQQEGLTFKQLWDAYGVPWGGSRYGVMPIGFLEWYKKRFV